MRPRHRWAAFEAGALPYIVFLDSVVRLSGIPIPFLNHPGTLSASLAAHWHGLRSAFTNSRTIRQWNDLLRLALTRNCRSNRSIADCRTNSGKQPGQRQARVGWAHEGFAHQEGLHGGGAPGFDTLRRQDAGFGDRQALWRHVSEHVQRG